MEGEICGQYARFLMYHPDYDELFEEWMYEDDDAYKEADKRAHGYVKKTLVKYYRENFGEVYPEAGNIFNMFSERIAPLKNNMIQLPDNIGKMATKLHKKFTMTANLKIDDEGAYVIDDKKDVLQNEIIKFFNTNNIKSLNIFLLGRKELPVYRNCLCRSVFIFHFRLKKLFSLLNLK
jgi:hypothetical protein